MKNQYSIFNFAKQFLLSLGVFLLFTVQLMAQKPVEKRSFEISLDKDEYVSYEIQNNKRVDLNTGLPIALYNVNIAVPEGTPESMAMYYLQQEHETLGIPAQDLANLRHHHTRTSLSGHVVRYRQYYQNLPVNKAEVTITISPDSKVVFVMNGYRPNVNLSNANPSVTADQAFETAYYHIGANNLTFYDDRLIVYNNNRTTRLAREVTISAQSPMGEWHVFVDAHTGEIFKAVDMACYYEDHDDKDKDGKKKKVQAQKSTSASMMATGTGMVFNPDPLSSNQVAYGATGYVDGNDANTTQLNNARFSVTLNDITFSGGMYSLVGPRAAIVSFDPPNTGLFQQATSTFNFTRQDQGFEAVNAYYHIDFLMNYINNTLGITLMPYQYSGGVQYDPHGWNGADNSSYSSGSGRLTFGEGCVDDAEDSDVIHHELGHGLHDWVTAGGLSQVDGLSEGSGDYVAQSYNRSLGYWQPTDPQYNWVFNWDGHNACWGGRTTAHTATYPGGLTGSIHTDGQIWATCLMGIWDQIGQQETDTIFYEGLAMTSGSSSQNDAANAAYQAALNLGYSNADIVIIHTSFTNCGYTLPALPGPPVAAFSADTPTICLDTNNMVNFFDETVPDGTSWVWTFEGASPSTSTDQNPTVTYSAAGMYDVTLEVTNSYGTDTVTYTDYITVLQGDDCPSCSTLTNNTPIAISASGAGNSYTSVINYTGSGEVTDVNVTINITHTWDADLDITLTSPSGTVVELTSDNGGDGDNYTNTVFDQEGSVSITAGTAPFSGTFVPEGNLANIYTEESNGNWTLTIVDDANQDGGTLNSWSLELCTAPELSVEEHQLDNLSIYPNPNNGSFNVSFVPASPEPVIIQVYDLRGRRIFNTKYETLGVFDEVVNLQSAQSGMYLLNISNGDKMVTKKILVE